MSIGLALLVLRCSNLERSKSFYEALGLCFASEKHGSGPAHYSCSLGDVLLELYPAGGRSVGGLRLGLRVADPSAAADAALAIGGRRSAGSAGALVLEDPDHNQVELLPESPQPKPGASSNLFRSALADALAPRQRILIAGAGGGFDVFAGLPLFFALRAAGKQVFLANLSFTYLGGSEAQRLSEVAWRVDHTNTSELDYFPERFLAQWLHREGYPSDVYAFEKLGVRPLRAAYEALVQDLELDALVLVDGGTDILMRGDEAGLGTPTEDMTSLAAARHLPIAKFVSCLGFGIDAFHGVCHAHFLENVAALERRGGYLGAHSIQLADPSVQKFRDAVEYAHSKMPSRPSIVNGSIVSALEGQFGDAQRTQRTRSSKLFINPLMAIYWHFDLAAVAEQSLYLSALEQTDDMFEVQAIIEAFHRSVTIRPRAPIPV